MLSQSNGKKGNYFSQKLWREFCLLTYCLKAYEQLINGVLHLLSNSDHSQHQLADKSMKEQPQIFKHQIPSGMNK